MKTVKQVSDLTGVSVRTLHHYDDIGLLKPTAVTAAGYRLYDDAAIARLHSILLFRELQFPLKEIRQMLDRRDFHPEEALAQQIKLLELRYQNLGKLIDYARELQQKGVQNMDFAAFDKSEINAYQEEVRQKWGNTEVYRESQSRQIPQDANEKMMGILKELGSLQYLSPANEKVQTLVARLQTHICDNYYTCSKEVLAGLGKMYVEDERFLKNINSACGQGSAEFISEAIAEFCKN